MLSDRAFRCSQLCIGGALALVGAWLVTAQGALAVVPVNVGVNAASVSGQVPANALGLHTSVYANTFTNSQLDDRLVESGTQLLRYPGGSYSDLYHFSVPPTSPYYTCCNSGLPDVTKPHPMTPFPGFDPGIDPPGSDYPFGYYASGSHFPNFLNLLDASGTEAMITVNYGSSLGKFDSGSGKWLTTKGGQPNEAAAWVAYANADASIYGTPNDVVLGVDAEGINWRTAGYWARLRASTQAEYQSWATTDGVYDAANTFLAVNRDNPVGIKYWEIGNEINGNGFYDNGGPGWEADFHGAYDGSRFGDVNLSPQTYGANFIQFAQAMKNVDPTIQLGGVLVGPLGVGDTGNNTTSWDRRFLLAAGNAQVTVNGQNYNALDFGILHWYIRNNADNGSATQEQLEANILSTVSNNLINQQFNYTVTPSLPTVFNELRNRIDLYTNRDPATFPIHMTEFGYFNGIGNNNIVTGLFAADVYATALGLGAESVHFLEMSSLFLQDNMTRLAAFRGMQMLDRYFDPGDEMIAATSSTAGLKMHAVRKPDGSVAVLMINTLTGSANDAEVTFDIDGVNLDDSGTQWLWGDGFSSGAPIETAVGGLGNSFMITVPDRTAMVLLIPAAAGQLGDFDGDLDVDGVDFLIWQRGETSPAYDPQLLVDWETYYGTAPLVAESTAVPEPTALALAAFLFSAATFHRKRRT